MQRQPKRASSVKALRAIKENSLAKKSSKTKNKVVAITENVISLNNGVKRQPSPSAIVPPNPKRNALGNITNAVVSLKPMLLKPQELCKDKITKVPQRRSQRLKQKDESRKSSPSLDMSVSSCEDIYSQYSEDTPVTAVQNFLQATTLSDDSLRSDECVLDEDEDEDIKFESTQKDCIHWKDIDAAEEHDPLFSSEYAPSIYQYMKEREDYFIIPEYLDNQPNINASMRTILVDWLVEVQENFELFHETLYLAVKTVDRYLSKKEVKKEYLQLVGATSMLIASKFEELSPPLVDDFIYLCDDAYTHNELLKMECDILSTMDYDLNVPVSYRFIRRLARAADANMETHTLARYISESTLQEYSMITIKPSLIAAGSMYLAIRMKKLGTWTPTLEHYSGYCISDILPTADKLNDLISLPTINATTVRSKYSHEVFFKVALTPCLSDVEQDSIEAMSELTSLLSNSQKITTT